MKNRSPKEAHFSIFCSVFWVSTGKQRNINELEFHCSFFLCLLANLVPRALFPESALFFWSSLHQQRGLWSSFDLSSMGTVSIRAEHCYLAAEHQLELSRTRDLGALGVSGNEIVCLFVCLFVSFVCECLPLRLYP